MPSDWQRVAADPALRAAVTRRYRGSGDALDALWWLEHPGAPTPAGIRDPAEAAETARRDLFRRDGGTASADQVEQAAARAAADRESVRLALADAERELLPAAEVRSPPSRSRPTRAALVGAVVAALAIGGTLGFGAGRFAASGRPAALAVFDRAQRADDRPPSTAQLPAGLVRASTRHLGDSSTTGVAVYGAETADGRVCLLAVVLAERFTATCSTRTAFEAQGLAIALQATADPTDDSGTGTLQEVDPRWAPDGRLSF